MLVILTRPLPGTVGGWRVKLSLGVHGEAPVWVWGNKDVAFFVSIHYLAGSLGNYTDQWLS